MAVALYARKSVERENSVSCETQLEYCRAMLRPEERGEAVLLPLDAYFAPYPAYTIPSPGRENRVRNGNPITDARLKDGTYRVYGGDGTFLCLSEAKGGTLTAVKNFFET